MHRKGVRRRNEEHLHHIVEMYTREADPESVDKHQPRSQQRRQRVELCRCTGGEGDGHDERAAQGREEALWSELAIRCIWLWLFVRARCAAVKSQGACRE